MPEMVTLPRLLGVWGTESLGTPSFSQFEAWDQSVDSPWGAHVQVAAWDVAQKPQSEARIEDRIIFFFILSVS